MWALLERLQHKRSSATGMVTGAVVGLVIITPAAGYVSPLGALVMGFVGCALVYPTFQLSHRRVDDSLDAFPCHGVASFVGACLTGVFAKDGGLLYGGGLRLLGVEVLAAVATAVYAASVTAAIFFVLSRFMRMRVHEHDESIGLDNACHGEMAYGMNGATPISPFEHTQGTFKSAGAAQCSVASVTESGNEDCADLEAPSTSCSTVGA